MSACDDIVRERGDVVLGDLGGELPAKPWADEAPQMARNVAPRFYPRPHFFVWLANRRFHPRDPLRDDLIDGLAALGLLQLAVAEGLGERRRTHASQTVDLAAGVLDGEGLGIVDAEPAGALFAGRRIGELEREAGDAGDRQAGKKAGAFAVINLDPRAYSLFTVPIGQDDTAVAHALGGSGFYGGCGSISHGIDPGVDWTMGGAFALVASGGEGPGPRIGETRRNSPQQAYAKSACFKGLS
jgi:hypothetical protein